MLGLSGKRSRAANLSTELDLAAVDLDEESYGNLLRDNPQGRLNRRDIAKIHTTDTDVRYS